MIASDLLEGLGYDDVVMIPIHVSEIEHRKDVDISVEFCGRKLQCPIIASPMPDVISSYTFNCLWELGAFGFLHRFADIDIQIKEFKNTGGVAGCSIGASGDWYERFSALYDAGCNIFLIDTANGANTQVGKAIEKIQQRDSKLYIIAGNVASSEGYEYLAGFGIEAVRVGIAGGSACTTKLATGVYSPMVTTISECFETKQHKNYNTKIIADGSIKKPADLCKGLACGADLIMMGSAIASTEESPSHVMKIDGQLVKVYRGAASFSTQKYEAGKDPEYVEGMESIIPYTGSLAKTIKRYCNGLRSSMSYMNSKTIADYQASVLFMKYNHG